VCPTPAPTPQPTPRPTPPGVTPQPSPLPTPFPAGLACSSYSSSCAACTGMSNCRFCGTGCVDVAAACTDSVNVAPSGVCPTPTPEIAATSAATTSTPANSTVSAADSPPTFVNVAGESSDLGLFIGVGVGLFLLLLLVIVAVALVIRRRRGRDENEDIGGLSEIIDGRVKVVGNEYGSMSGIAAISNLGSPTLPGRTSEYASVASMRDYDAVSPITYASVQVTGQTVYDVAFPSQPQ